MNSFLMGRIVLNGGKKKATASQWLSCFALPLDYSPQPGVCLMFGLI